jgi:queuine tRNA-ribosyltransferase
MHEFDIAAQDPHSEARVGVFYTPHGAINTPAFAPVGTQATVKTLTPRDLHEVGAQLVLANTYHLSLRPGADLIAQFGGLHSFMAWPGPILTDSGGFQVFSLAQMRKVDADGVTFRSHIDGSRHRFTPESATAAQEALGADIIMCLDECVDPIDRAYNEAALLRTHAWAARCKTAQRRPEQALFGIVQGGIFADLRVESARALRELDFAGYAVGGLSVGETKAQMYAVLDVTCPEMPSAKPRYLMGVGAPDDILEAVARGIDIFDCVLPTRLARNGALLTRRGRMNLRNARYVDDPLPVEPGCACYTCQHFSRAYLRHLYRARETSGLHLATVHNVHFMLQLMAQIRSHIAEGTFSAFKRLFLSDYELPDQEMRHAQRARYLAGRQAGAAAPGARRKPASQERDRTC